MPKIAVNPSLFVTCRLCLEDLGHYQISPDVKEKILYCFGIAVELFDGLPQLICQKCEVILSAYTATKKQYVEKQKDLKHKLQEYDSVKLSIDQPKTNGSTKRESGNHNQDIGGIRNASTSSWDIPLEQPSKKKELENDSKSSTEMPVKWPKSYKKNYVCRICNKYWSKVETLKYHIYLKHYVLMHKNSIFFKLNCEVRLNKTDGKHNITGSNSKVMLTRNKIIESINPTYYKTYNTKFSKDEQTELSDSNGGQKTNRCYQSSNYSDDDNYVVVCKRRKRTNRLCSRSSNETVVLDTTNKSNTSDDFKESRNSPNVSIGECIQIEDSSNDESENNENVSKTKTEKQIPANNDTINEVMITSNSKYKRKHQDGLIMKSNTKASLAATQLKRKILSIGRKTINKKKKISCLPVLKFMARKNVNADWTQLVLLTYLSVESNYIRIMPTLKPIGENRNSEITWGDFATPNKDFAPSGPSVNALEVSQCNTDNNGIQCTVEVVSVPEIALAKSVVSTSDANLTGTDIKKLLNANPVANPKQLPKKSVPTETKTVNNPNPNKSASNETKTVNNLNPNEPASNQIKTVNYLNPNKSASNETKTVNNLSPNKFASNETETVDSLAPNKSVSNETKIVNNFYSSKSASNTINTVKVVTTKQQISNAIISSQEDNLEFFMPIITSTASLAPPLIIHENDAVSSNPEMTTKKPDDKRSDAPRIKVKPVTELMSLETLSRMQEPAQMSCIVTSQPSNMALREPEPAPRQNEFMILDTTELPNTRTRSPYQYFKKLLQLHNITLLDTDAVLSSDFNCLIKFKVLYKQETSNEPVVLCIAIFCSKNVFCLQVKDRNQVNLNLSNVSPNWQWEVLKIYKGDVVNKLLNNARKIGSDVYEFTSTFLCLLKSIKLVNM